MVDISGVELNDFYVTDGKNVCVNGNMVIDSAGAMVKEGIFAVLEGKIKFIMSAQNQSYIGSVLYGTKIKPIILTNVKEEVFKPAFIYECHNKKLPFSFRLVPNKDTLLYETYHGQNIKIKYKINSCISCNTGDWKCAKNELMIQKYQNLEDSENASLSEPFDFMIDATPKSNSKGSVIDYIGYGIYGLADKILPGSKAKSDDNSIRSPSDAKDKGHIGENSQIDNSEIEYLNIYSYKDKFIKEKPKEVNLTLNELNGIPSQGTQPKVNNNQANQSDSNGIKKVLKKPFAIMGYIYSFEGKGEEHGVALPLGYKTNAYLEFDENSVLLNESLLLSKTNLTKTKSISMGSEINGIMIKPKLKASNQQNSSSCNLFEAISTEELNVGMSSIEKCQTIHQPNSPTEQGLNQQLPDFEILTPEKKYKKVRYSLDSLNLDLSTTNVQKNSRHSLDPSELNKPKMKTLKDSELIKMGLAPKKTNKEVLLTGVMDTKVCPINKPLTGEVTVVHNSATLESIELHLLALETCGKGYEPDESLIKITKIADGDVCVGQSIPFQMVFPHLLTCPTVITDTFKIEFAIKVVVITKKFENASITVPIKIIRTSKKDF